MLPVIDLCYIDACRLQISLADYLQMQLLLLTLLLSSIFPLPPFIPPLPPCFLTLLALLTLCFLPFYFSLSYCEV